MKHMNYIVFDLEWNQCPYGKGQENHRIPFEIIEIGAVKLNSEKQIIDQFQVLIQPRVYKKLHFRTKEIIQLDIKDLEKGEPFYKAIREFMHWCGEDYQFCTWGNTDLLELQRNMKYYGVLQLLKGPIYYLDAQKLFSMGFEDGESRKALEYAVDFLGVEKELDFHRAFADAWYTAKVFSKLNADLVREYYSIDCYQNPKSKEEEVLVVYPDYEKLISREFDTKEELLLDKEIASSRCCICGKSVRKKIRWFSAGPKTYYCLAKCAGHGWLKGKIRVKKTEDGKIFVVKTMKLTDEAEADMIKEKKEEIKRKRKERKKLEKEAKKLKEKELKLKEAEEKLLKEFEIEEIEIEEFQMEESSEEE